MKVETNKHLTKGGFLKSHSLKETDLSVINELTLEPVGADDIYTFDVVACDNDIDRDFENFDDEALEQLAALFPGKTFIKDHRWSADNQFARAYAAEVQDTGEKTSDGRDLKCLVVNCYMLATGENEHMISEIKAGIKKEVSIGFAAKSVICSICGADNRKTLCMHYGGKDYEGQTCHFTLSDVSDLYELSFVAVPAQRRAGTRKDYLSVEWPDEVPVGKPTGEDGGEPPEDMEKQPDERARALAVAEAYMEINR